MANITNLDAAFLNRTTRLNNVQGATLARGKRESDASSDVIPSAKHVAKIQKFEEAQRSRDSSNQRGRAITRDRGHFQRMTLEELAEMLRKVNLTFDTFEIRAKFTINMENGDLLVEVINERTGEVIRRIPPYDVPDVAESLINSGSAVTDIKA